MNKTVDVQLGGRDFTIRPLPIKPARAWRAALREPFTTVLNTLDTLTGAGELELTNFAAIKNLVQPVVELVLDSTDTLLDLLFSYSPELRRERDWLEENATDEEALTALVEVVKLAYPFSSLWTAFQTGRASTATKKSSVSPPGM